jgi:D-arabinose 1-dehydrogenase-like Zn-dependent alcohol dehydrogenase
MKVHSKNVNLRVEKGKAEVIEVPIPKASGKGFVVVESAYAGICTEQKCYDQGYYEAHEGPVHLGHEGCGTIVEVGPGVCDYEVGDRVIMHIGWSCGHCYVCESGRASTNCANLKVASDMEDANGCVEGGGGAGFNRFRLVHSNNLQKIPDSLDFRYARAANCSIGSTYSIVRNMDVGPQTYALVAGVGFIGHAVIANLKHRGATVIGLGRNQDRLNIAKRVGLDHVINPDAPDWLEQINAITPDGRGVDVSYECSGHPDYQRKSLDAIRKFGTLVVMGYQMEKDWTLDVHVHDDILLMARTITGMEDLELRHRAEMLEVLQDPAMQQRIDDMFEEDVSIYDAEDVFKKILTKKHGKFFFHFNDVG